MPDFVRVIPADGRLVRDLEGRRIPAEGAVVDRAKGLAYWTRRELAGDVTFTEAPTEPASIPAPAPAPVEE